VARLRLHGAGGALIARLAGIWAGLNKTLRWQKDELRAALARLHDAATRDELTRIPNRRHVAELIDAARAEADQRREPCAIALIDLDHFKRINDRFGHEAGDRVLRHFAEVALRALRSSDVIGRWGGEEFLVMLPGTDVAGACEVLQRLRSALAAPESTFQEVGGVTFSAGVAALDHRLALETAVAEADVALYRAKEAGRDRVEASAPGPQAAWPVGPSGVQAA
jgi:diguanylate cyclase